ncbi:high affinity copper uptake protein 1-like [Anthonomus grandis grandis]|uniref:high affinity copper uptake protein 1-like n=1 Tax=Anthonomus grandis grandis TaxID=2921223 RepID=UPI002165CA97|nr:high affinity copper uptake protein 1-like [Anthonomus grandis grandis]
MDNMTQVSHNMDDMDMGGGMAMYFTFSTSATILFKQWKVHTVGGFAGSMVAVFALAFLYQALKFYRSYLLLGAAQIRNKNQASGDVRFTELNIMSKSHLIQTLFHGIQAIISYFLMLIFMTYNGGLCIAVVLGLVCGYFVFGWKISIGDDHCA